MCCCAIRFLLIFRLLFHLGLNFEEIIYRCSRFAKEKKDQNLLVEDK